MVILWITEALPLAVTALIGPVLAIILQVAPARAVFAPFADPIIFLFIGSFMLAEAMFAHGLDRRIAFGALSSRAVGGSPTRILLVYGAVATGISMWISNTATTAMMFPIGLSIVAHLTKGQESDVASPQFCDRDDADGRLRRVDRWVGDAHRDAPESHRQGHAGTDRPSADFVPPMDDARRPTRGAPVRVPGRLLPVESSPRAHSRSGAGRAHPGRVAKARTDFDRPAQYARGVRRDRRALAVPWRSGHRRPRRQRLRQGIRACRAGIRGRDDRRDSVVRAAGQLESAPIHVELGAGGPHRLGHHPALRRRPGDGGARVLDRARRVDRPRNHRMVAGALDAVAHDSLHGRGDRDVRRPPRIPRRPT